MTSIFPLGLPDAYREQSPDRRLALLAAGNPQILAVKKVDTSTCRAFPWSTAAGARPGSNIPTLADWPSSSYPFVVGREAPPPWLNVDWLLPQFAPERGEARRAYVEFLLAGWGLPSPVLEARQPLVLGDRAFVERHCQKGIPEQLREFSKAHRRAVALPLDEYAMRYPERDVAMAEAYRSGACTMAEIGRHFAVLYITVNRAVRKYELQPRKTGEKGDRYE